MVERSLKIAAEVNRWFVCGSRKAFISLTLAILSTFSFGCLPKEVALPSNITLIGSEGATYEGFSGVATAQTIGATKVKLQWKPTTDKTVVAYNIYDTTMLFDPKLIRTVPAPASEVTLSGLANQTLYRFRVRAANAEAKEDGNEKDLAAIPYGGIVSAQVTGSDRATIVFNDGTNADEIGIFCRAGESTEWAKLLGVKNVKLTQGNVVGLEPGVEYTCRAALVLDGFTDNNTETVTFTPMGEAAKLAYLTQPGSANAGVALAAQPVVAVQDASGNTVTAGPDSTAIISLTLATTSPTGGSVRGTASVAAVKGVATFSGLNLQEAGLKILTASKQDTSSVDYGTASFELNSDAFTITAGAVSPAQSTIAISPEVPPNAALVANGSASYTVTVTLKDAYGNPIVGTKPAFASTVSGDTLIQPTVASNASGQSTGTLSSTVADTVASPRQLRISTPAGLSTVTTLAPFVPGPATKLAFSAQPSNSPAGIMGLNQIQVAVQDAQGNVVTSGDSATSDITISISANVNGAILTGTATATSVGGVATFSGLGIDRTATGYRLMASSGAFTPAYSNSFNITAGIPRKIVVLGPTSVVSGLCSTAVTIQLQDLGNNPTNAIQNTPIQISGLGAGSLYSSSSCAGTALTSTLTFTAGTNTRTVYLKNPKAEAVVLTGSDTSAVLQAGSKTINVKPSKIGLLAQAASPAAPGTPLSVVSGRCSTEILITPAGENGTIGQTFDATPVTITGLIGSGAEIFSDSTCTTELDPTNLVLQPTTSPNFSTKIYLKDPRAETLALSVSDPSGAMATTSGLQTVTILPSTLDFTGPTTVVAGQCSSVYNLTLKDTEGTAVAALADTPLTINGIPGASVGRFYTNASCTGTASRTSVTISQNSSSIQLYFKSLASETLNLFMSDPATNLNNSQTITLSISPSALRVTGPVGGTSATSVCAGPFTVNTLDGANAVTAAINAVTVNLSGQGSGGGFFSDSACDQSITQLTFGSGVSAQTFYFLGNYPAASLTLTATDSAAVLTSGSTTHAVTASPGWIGTAAKTTDANGDLLWFRTGVTPVAARQDGFLGAYSIRFDPTKTYLYVADNDYHRVVKYDYVNKKYLGWIGRLNFDAGRMGLTGSNLTTPSSAQCVSTTHWAPLPGWCTGGIPGGDGRITDGGICNPQALVEDGDYLYTVNNCARSAITRHVASTGAFAGWIGTVESAPTGPASGGPSSCLTTTTNGTPTPGWCIGGLNRNGVNPNANGTNVPGNGTFVDSRAMAHDSLYLYVAAQGAILRFQKSDGSFQGWVGVADATAPTGGAAGCTSVTNGKRTPGWCMGGTYKRFDVRGVIDSVAGGGIQHPTGLQVIGTTLYVMHTDYLGTVSTFDTTTGAFSGLLTNIPVNSWNSPFQMTTDGTDLFFADWTRVIKTDLTGLVLGWIGKVNNNSSLSGALGCSTLAPNANTPGWCLGGTSKHGVDETSVNRASAIEYDGNGNIIVGQSTVYPGLKIFNSTTGVYGGMLAFESASPRRWSGDANQPAQLFGFDDKSMYMPTAVYNDGTFLYVAERTAGRIKKIRVATGETVGWIGGVTTSPTGGDTGCAGSNAMTASPGWCLGSLFNPNYLWNLVIPQQTNGLLNDPMSITGDGTYLYVTDRALHRIVRFNSATGVSAGWLGRISISPTGGAAGCNGAAVNSFTPGWCTGGYSALGFEDGNLNQPGGITYAAGNLYVVDTVNGRVNSYNATTGAFNGWIGGVQTDPTSGCTFAVRGPVKVSTSGWCKGGQSVNYTAGLDHGGAFYFELWGWRGGITSDGTHLYISNPRGRRIDKIALDGTYVAGASPRTDQYINTWTAAGTGLTTGPFAGACSYPNGNIWNDGTHLYGTTGLSCNGWGTSAVVFKMELSTGRIIGWRGGINPGGSPSAGDAGCAGATITTPGWCQGGQPADGFKLGQFFATAGVSGDANFVYIANEDTHRITRLPK